MMTRSSFSSIGKRVLVWSALLLAGLPLLGRAQSTPPKPTPTPAPTAPPPATPPAATVSAVDSAAKAAAAPATPKMPTLSDADRTALRAEVDRELKTLGDSLALTPQQKAQARPILLDHGYQAKGLRDKYAGQERTQALTDAMRKDLQVLRDSTDVKLAVVLTGAQMTRYKAKRDEWLARTRTRFGVPGTAGAAAPAGATTPAAPAGTPAPGDTAKKK